MSTPEEREKQSAPDLLEDEQAQERLARLDAAGARAVAA